MTANLSAFHLSALRTGVQTAILGLGFNPEPDAKLYGAFVDHIRENFGADANSEFNVIVRHTASRRESVHVFLESWKRFWAASPERNVGGDASADVTKCFDLLPNLFSIEHHPEMFLPEAEISYLKAFLEGIDLIVAHFALGTRVIPDFTEFEKWVASRRSGTYVCPWDLILMCSCGGNGARAFRMFFDELRDYAASSEVNSTRQP